MSRFKLIIRHKIDKVNIISDALLRLKNDVIIKEQKLNILNVLYEHLIKQKLKASSYEYEEVFIYYITLIKMSNDFKIKLKETYKKNE